MYHDQSLNHTCRDCSLTFYCFSAVGLRKCVRIFPIADCVMWMAFRCCRWSSRRQRRGPEQRMKLWCVSCCLLSILMTSGVRGGWTADGGSYARKDNKDRKMRVMRQAWSRGLFVCVYDHCVCAAKFDYMYEQYFVICASLLSDFSSRPCFLVQLAYNSVQCWIVKKSRPHQVAPRSGVAN